MPRVQSVDFKRESTISRISSRISSRIREKIDTIGSEYVIPVPLQNKYPNEKIIDLNNNQTNIAGFNQNPWGNFEDKTTGMNGSIAHGNTKDSGNYPHQKNGVYEDIPKTKDYFKGY